MHVNRFAVNRGVNVSPATLLYTHVPFVRRQIVVHLIIHGGKLTFAMLPM
jgi:hypothetical protein